ncbi:MAG: SRPBCC domain-containing protein [Cyclobacteriaceae bacterium]
MNENNNSKSSIKIQASPAMVWDALVNKEIAKEYFHGAEVWSSWEEGSPITFKGEFNGNEHEEKGVILKVVPGSLLQYSHWSHFDGLPDEPENYRTWTFSIADGSGDAILSVSEDNIPTEAKKLRSDEFWNEVLQTIKRIVEQ